MVGRVKGKGMIAYETCIWFWREHFLRSVSDGGQRNRRGSEGVEVWGRGGLFTVLSEYVCLGTLRKNTSDGTTCNTRSKRRGGQSMYLVREISTCL